MSQEGSAGEGASSEGPVRVAIIGPASHDPKPLGAALLERALVRAREQVEMIANVNLGSEAADLMVLVAGGKAWVEHLAVLLARERGCALELCLPCPWDAERRRFVDNGDPLEARNPGAALNKLHGEFSHQVGFDSLWDLHCVITGVGGCPRAHLTAGEGFETSNNLISTADYLIAFTHEPRVPVPFSATGDMWARFSGASRWHFTLA